MTKAAACGTIRREKRKGMKRMNIKAAIWDLDGTLLNTLDDLAASTNAALAANGLPTHTTDEVRMFVGNGIGKAATLFGGAKNAGVILGAKVPIVLVSRSDSAYSKLASIAAGSVLSRRMHLS